MLRNLTLLLSSAFILSGCLAENQLTDAEISSFLEGNTVRYDEIGSIGADYHDGRGNLLFISDGDYGIGKYTIADDQICYVYPPFGENRCFIMLRTDEPGVVAFKNTETQYQYLSKIAGPGNLLSRYE